MRMSVNPSGVSRRSATTRSYVSPVIASMRTARVTKFMLLYVNAPGAADTGPDIPIRTASMYDAAPFAKKTDWYFGKPDVWVSSCRTVSPGASGSDGVTPRWSIRIWPTGLDHLHDHDRGDRLGDAGDAEAVGDVGRLVGSRHPDAERRLVRESAVDEHGHRGGDIGRNQPP